MQEVHARKLDQAKKLEEKSFMVGLDKSHCTTTWHAGRCHKQEQDMKQVLRA